MSWDIDFYSVMEEGCERCSLFLPGSEGHTDCSENLGTNSFADSLLEMDWPAKPRYCLQILNVFLHNHLQIKLSLKRINGALKTGCILQCSVMRREGGNNCIMTF